MVSVFIGTSLDGFIAREDGDLEWLTSTPDSNQDYGYDGFFARIDALVMGRGTFDKMATFDKWYYGSKPVIVLTHRPLPAPKFPEAKIESMSGTPDEIVERLARKGHIRLYVDGGRTIQQFLAAGLVDEIILSRVPVLIGTGIPLFGPLPRDVKLRHMETRTFPGGMIQSRYLVQREP